MKYTLIALLLLFPVLALAACGDDDDDDDETSVPTSAVPTGTEGETPTQPLSTFTTGLPTASAVADVCPENTDPASSDVGVIDLPESGDSSSSPLTVAGAYTAFEAQFNISILDADGTAIVDNIPAMSSEGQTQAPFEVEVPFEVTEETPACLQVYDISEADGTTKSNIIQVPVTLLP